MRTAILLLIASISSVAPAQEFNATLDGLLASEEISRAILQCDSTDPANMDVQSFRCPDSGDRIACVAGWINAPVERVWKIIRDYSEYGHLIPRCKRSLIVHPNISTVIRDSKTIPSAEKIAFYAADNSPSRDTTLLYSEIDIIYPIGLVRSLLQITCDSTEYSIYWRQVASNVRVYEGAWRLFPRGNRTEVVCMTRFRFNVWMPPFLIHKGVRYYFPRIIIALRKRVNQQP